MRFMRNGRPTNPFAIRRVDIYRGTVRSGNLVSQIIFPDRADPAYPAPAAQTTGDIGEFEVLFAAPADFVPNDIYYDVWYYVGSDPGTGTEPDDTSLWISHQGRFWLYDDIWVVDEELRTKKLGFEPLDKKLRRGEIRALEVAIHPLPKHNFHYNELIPLLPTLTPTVTVWTTNNELIAGMVDAPCRLGIRQGHHRGSPFVIQCSIDTRTMLRGTYKYAVKVQVGDQTIISDKYFFTVQ